MGHQRLGTLPKTRSWQAVIDLITDGASALQVAQATARAAKSNLQGAGHDPSLIYAFWLLTQLPLAARQENFEAALRRLGLAVPSQPHLTEICTAFMAAVDGHLRTVSATDDFSEMTVLAATESLYAMSAGESLFGTTYVADEAKAALHRLAAPRSFGILARDFFARLLRRCVDYYLSRELPNHVGRHRRFPSLQDHNAFERAIETHCHETAFIVEAFAAEWFSKHNYEGRVTPSIARAFVYVAFNKLIAELERRHPADA